MDSTHEDKPVTTSPSEPEPSEPSEPKPVVPVAVEIVPGRQYPVEIWDEVTQSMEAADQLVAKMRALKRAADLAYDEALELRVMAQVPRDQMIFSDPRPNATVARLAGIGRARVDQLRVAHREREANRKREAE